METHAAVTTLVAQRDRFKAFLAARLGSEADAEDLLQHGLVKALHRAGEVRDETRLVAWFYQLLRNALADHVRSRQSARQRETAFADLHAEPDAERQLCGCFERLIDTLKPTQAALLRKVELEGQSVAAAASALGLTANNASVTLHRARAALREKLAAFCGPCADGACLDCDCEESDT
ncbi:MAG TPA: sigma-70 family RNA polymerase sigma factor [Opitutaceae bacterium]